MVRKRFNGVNVLGAGESGKVRITILERTVREMLSAC